MKKVFIYAQSLMNGTMTLQIQMAAFASRELAEQFRVDVLRDFAQRGDASMSLRYCDVQEVGVYESKDQIPFYQFKEEFDEA